MRMTEKSTIGELLAQGAEELTLAAVEDPLRESELLLCHCLGMTRTKIYLEGHALVGDMEKLQFKRCIARRAAREPTAYILGEREFWSLDFHVAKEVLIPRPETEFLLEKVVALVSGDEVGVNGCLDLCCGSGVIAVVLARELRAEVLATDISEDALAITRKNALRHDVGELVSTRRSDLFASLGVDQSFGVIVSNPPYVRSGEIMDQLQPEVARYEPRLALDGGSDGLEIIRRIASRVLYYLRPGGKLFMEFGHDQGEDIVHIFENSRADGRRFAQLSIFPDYSGRDRVLYGVAE